MEYVILGLLIMRPASLYDLQQAFKAGISLFYSASYGSIQRTVSKIVDKSWAEFEEVVEGGRNKKIHTITDGGKEAFQKWMTSPLETGAKLEAHALTKLYFLGLVDGSEKKQKILENMIQVTEENLAVLTATKEQIVAANPGVEQHPQFQYPIKTLDYGIMSHSASLEWFKGELERTR